MPVQLQKHVLRQFFGRGAILKEVKRDAEHHRLVAADEVLEIERLRVARVDRARELGPHLSVNILLGTYTRRMGRRDAGGWLFFFGLRRRRRAHADDLQQARLVLRAVVVNLFRRVDDEAAGGHRLEAGRIVFGAGIHPPRA